MSEDLVVELPEELETSAPEKEGEESPKVTKVAEADSPLAKQVEAMKRQKEEADSLRLAAENRARDEAAARQRVEQENQRLSQHAEQANQDVIARSIEAKQAEVAKAEDEYRLAMESGNFGEAAKVQTRLSKAAAVLARLEMDKESRATPTTEGRVVQQQQYRPAGDPVDNYIESLSVSDRAKGWLRTHKECVSDAGRNAVMMRAHHSALGEGLAADSDAYFEHLETKLGFRQAEDGDGGDDGSVEVEIAPKPVKKVLAAAPVSRPATSLNGSSKGQPRKITLTAEQREAADLYMNPDWSQEKRYIEYAKELERARIEAERNA